MSRSTPYERAMESLTIKPDRTGGGPLPGQPSWYAEAGDHEGVGPTIERALIDLIGSLLIALEERE